MDETTRYTRHSSSRKADWPRRWAHLLETTTKLRRKGAPLAELESTANPQPGEAALGSARFPACGFWRLSYLFSASVVFVAQTASLLYRRMPSCRTAPWAGRRNTAKALPICNRRYGRLAICATLNRYRDPALRVTCAKFITRAGAPRSARPVVNRYAAEGRAFMPGFVRFADTICKKGTNPLPIMPSRAAIPFWHLRCSRRSRNRRVPVRSLWLATTALHGVMSSLPVQGSGRVCDAC